ncbi:hypothetical protein LSAT2_016346 [Lamellibrachia satsuma]|nr:hypothetical protein LSAT2_016346 [Lamellibrachia satsuma]
MAAAWLLAACLGLLAGAIPGLARFVGSKEANEKWLDDYIQEIIARNDTRNAMQADSPVSPPVGGDLRERPSCPPTPDYFPASWCQRPACQSDDDCNDFDERCCFNGCVDACTMGVPPSPVVDWLRQPPTKILGRSWLVGGEEEEQAGEVDPDNDLDEPCSTSRLAGDSLLCPHGFACRITYRGDRRKGIPNRGRCVPHKQRTHKGKS